MLLLLMTLVNVAFADSQLKCDYAFDGFPTASLTFSVADDGSPSPTATINESGITHQETLTAQAKGAGEFFHGWLSKESADNSVELIVYTTKQSGGNSDMINHHVPMGQDMWGDCTGF